MSTFCNSLDFTLSLEVKTCVRDPSSFAGQVKKCQDLPAGLKCIFSMLFGPAINSAVCSLGDGLLLPVSKLFG